MERTLNIDLPAHKGEQVKIAGWVHNIRSMGQVNFLLVRDRTAVAQVVLTPEEMQPLAGLQLESVVEVVGTVQEGPTQLGVELQNPTVTVISPVTDVLPFELYKKELNVSLPVFLDHSVIGLRHPKRRAIMALQSAVMEAFRAALRRRQFTEIQTPKLVAAATESGANVFPVKYFDDQAFLAQSPQFYKQIMVGVFERVFEVGPVFRAEPHDTTRHINEYVSLDAEMGFINDHRDVMQVLNSVILEVVQHLTEQYAAELKLLDTNLPAVPVEIPAIYFPDAQKLLADKLGQKDALTEPDLSPEHERALGTWAKKEYNSDFLFVTGYPMVKRPFYTHPNPQDPDYANGFDMLFRGVELVTGGQRLHRYEDYLNAAQKHNFPLEPFKEYFETFQFGMPPHGGFAVGLERFLFRLLERTNIREVTLFPRDLKRLRP